MGHGLGLMLRLGLVVGFLSSFRCVQLWSTIYLILILTRTPNPNLNPNPNQVSQHGSCLPRSPLGNLNLHPTVPVPLPLPLPVTLAVA